MGRNSKARRDARRRKDSRHKDSQRGQQQGRASDPFRDEPFGSGDARAGILALAELEVTRHLRQIGVRTTSENVRGRAQSLLRSSVPGWAMADVVRDLLETYVFAALEGSWGPADLAAVVARFVGSGHDAAVAGILGRPGHQGAWPALWHDELSSLGRSRPLALTDEDDLALALGLIPLLAALPGAPRPPVEAPQDPGSPVTSATTRESAKLAQVRALLAKAESTSSTHEAEALSAKAQELISRYSLELLLEQESSEHADATYRRLWIDAPYVDAKATLVNEVAAANRCRAVLAPELALCTVVGTTFDLNAVELMVTSLLAQAQQAMLGHGSQSGRSGRSRTRSFRQSFLLSFAVHIGERLQQVAEESVAAAAEHTRAAMVPALRNHDVAVEELTEVMFPHLVRKSSTVSNAEGWAGGRAAAELAQLNVFDQVAK